MPDTYGELEDATSNSHYGTGNTELHTTLVAIFHARSSYITTHQTAILKFAKVLQILSNYR
jgi:hypothetical protein